MSNREDVKDDARTLLDPLPVPSEIPVGLDRRKFIMRSAVISAAAVMTGCANGDGTEGPSARSRICAEGRCARRPVVC